MGFIESLNKIGVEIPLAKTQLYQEIESHRSFFEKMGLSSKIKTDFDLFSYEIIYRGLLTQNQIENIYEGFLNQHYDLLDYLNYDEKQKMFNNDIAGVLETAPHFQDLQSQVMIYIPYLEPFVNQRYTHDYQMLLLKQHREYIQNFKVNLHTPIDMYGYSIFRTGFSSLENVYEDQRHICFYFDPLKTIYIFKKDNHEFLNKVIIQDDKAQCEVRIEDIQKIAYDIENYLYLDCLETLKDLEYISLKNYKKNIKKYK